MQSLWRDTWSLQIPKKIQMFMWRAIKESLPTKSNLMRHKIITNSVWELCNKGAEDVLHALWSYPVIQLVWSSEDWSSPFRALHFYDFAKLCCQVLQESRELRLAKFGVLCWALWQCRNKVRLNKPVDKIEQTNAFAGGYLDEFLQCNSQVEPPPAPHLQTRWTPPTQCKYKFNYDGFVFQDKGEMGLGIIVRDTRGSPIASVVQRIKYPMSVEAVEALAAKRAIKFALEIRIREGEFEGDSSTIVNSLINGDHCDVVFGLILEDALTMSLNLTTCKFLHVKHWGNSVAHLLA